MSYRIKASDPTLADALRRIAAEQLDKAIAALDGGAPTGDDIHTARKSAKKLRGLIRLVRPGFKPYKDVNADLRDAARAISGVRDRAALIDTYDRLADLASDSVDRPAIAPVRRELTLRLDAAERDGTLPARAAEARRAFQSLRHDVPDWTLRGSEKAILRGGLEQTLDRARDACRSAASSRDPEDLHDWRKRVKYHWYHLRLLRDVWPEITRPHIDVADRLSDLLGDQHDLVVFEAELHDPGLPDTARRTLLHPARSERFRLESEAITLGAFVHAAKPDHQARTWARWYRLWRRDQAAGLS
ncbi:CHAD domain-containing protein [Anianabacter salinae]|uniref:CHAD domain-containing protein n=1 Tax=Anianabacter salinae TaxID=2851023 RepID=UPI00225E1AED|nr:CHAD domain-containing protein [Anianabacter salinae]MBV0911010.1 CHAD domain-containing protein [Anianabacter salinae]